MSVGTEIERLNASKSAIAQAIRGKGVDVPEDAKIDTFADYVAMIGATQGIPVTFNGNPVVATDTIADQPFAGFKVYGKTARDETSGVVSAGEDGDSEFVVTGAQLFDADKFVGFVPVKGSNLTVEDGTISYFATGSDSYVGSFATAGNAIAESAKKVLIPVYPNTYYRVTADGDFTKNFVTEVGPDFIATKTQTQFADEQYFKTLSQTAYLLLRLGRDGAAGTRCSGKCMLSLSSTAIPWEPYQSQPLTLSTPSGLPGVPVSSGGNCTDSTGQAFTSDYWDFAAGLQHILCGQIASYNNEEITTPYISSTGSLTTGAKVVYVLPSPQTQPIPAETLAAYQALTSYAGTTVISTAEPVAGMEAKLYCDAEKTIDRKVSEGVAAAVKLSGGNV